MTWDLKEPECLSQARLMVAAPEFVYEQLKFYSENVGSLEGKEELEKLLLKRNEKLIDLALAQFATRKEIVQQLYHQACLPAVGDEESYNLGLRVGCLSNRHFDYLVWPNFDLDALMARGFTEEAHALLTNPSIPTSVLEALFKKSDCFAQVDEQNWLWMIQTGAENERLNRDRSNSGGPDTDLFRIQEAIFEFLETAPVTSRSVHAAMTLLAALNPRHTILPEEIAPVLERWGKVESMGEEGEEREGWYTHLPLREELRCLIASLYSRPRSLGPRSGVFGSSGDKDIARRCAFYAGTDLSEREIEAGFKKDKEVFLFAVLKNLSVFQHKKKRALIEKKLSIYEFIEDGPEGPYIPYSINVRRFIREYCRGCESFNVTPVSRNF